MFNGTISSVPQTFVVAPQLNSQSSTNLSASTAASKSLQQAASVLQSLPCQLLGQTSLVLTPVANGSTVTCAPIALTMTNQVQNVWAEVFDKCTSSCGPQNWLVPRLLVWILQRFPLLHSKRDRYVSLLFMWMLIWNCNLPEKYGRQIQEFRQLWEIDRFLKDHWVHCSRTFYRYLKSNRGPSLLYWFVIKWNPLHEQSYLHINQLDVTKK